MSIEKGIGKLTQLASIENQMGAWSEVYPTLKGKDIDRHALERLDRVPMREGFEVFYSPVVLPKFQEICGTNSDVFMDLRLINIFGDHCGKSNFALFNECIVSGQFLLQEKSGYDPFYESCKKQKGSFCVLRAQYGWVYPYSNSGIPILMDNEFHAPVGLAAASFCSHDPRVVFPSELNRWIACAGSGAEMSYGGGGEHQKIPCFEYWPNIGGASDTISVIPLGEMLAWEQRDSMNRGGFMTFVSPP